MPAESEERETVRWRAWPRKRCRGKATIFDFIAGRHAASGEVPGSTDNEIIDALTARERGFLVEWLDLCRHNGQKSSRLVKLDEGSEHIVYLADDGRNVMKVTRPGVYGDEYFLSNGRVMERRCTPATYLLRMELIRHHFGFAPITLAVTDQLQILSRQKFVEGDLPT